MYSLKTDQNPKKFIWFYCLLIWYVRMVICLILLDLDIATLISTHIGKHMILLWHGRHWNISHWGFIKVPWFFTETLDSQLIVAVSYTGKYNLVQACNYISQKVKDGLNQVEDINISVIEKELETNYTEFPYSDLLIWTSEELWVSRFLLWQLATWPTQNFSLYDHFGLILGKPNLRRPWFHFSTGRGVVVDEIYRRFRVANLL